MVTLKNILVATDFSEAANAAYRYGVNFARTHGANLHVLHAVTDVATFVVPPGSGVDVNQLQQDVEKEATKRLMELTQADRRDLNLRTAVLVSSATARTILAYARDEHIDLIVMGTQGRTGVATFFLGSVAQHVVRSAPCPVLSVHHPEREFVHPDPQQVVGRHEPVPIA